MERSETAIDHFNNGCSCAQSVVLTFKDKLGLDEDMLKKAASAFGSGMGRLQSVCGALTGAYIVLGLTAPLAENKEERSEQYGEIRKLTKAFEEKRGSTVCRELTGCDFLTEEGEAYFQENGLKQSICTPCVTTAVELLEKML